jgi:hypothetical protein
MNDKQILSTKNLIKRFIIMFCITYIISIIYYSSDKYGISLINIIASIIAYAVPSTIATFIYIIGFYMLNKLYLKIGKHIFWLPIILLFITFIALFILSILLTIIAMCFGSGNLFDSDILMGDLSIYVVVISSIIYIAFITELLFRHIFLHEIFISGRLSFSKERCPQCNTIKKANYNICPNCGFVYNKNNENENYKNKYK